ncbi:MAG TPA: Hsp70 family protein [Caulobacterales bacterium]|nr:Hsp70 family protein [Caulobacterales bacterium]
MGDRAAQATEWAIGVDFGTAYSKAAATRLTFEHGSALREIRPLRLGEAAGQRGAFLAPSSMFLDRSRVHFGARAVERLFAADLDQRELVRSFKTILGVSDFEGALNFFPHPSVDPDRVFRLRDLIILYLAYLLVLVDVAAAGEFKRTGEIIPTSRLRFTRPGWIPGRIAAAHEAMTSLFNQAHIVRRTLGDELLAAEGVSYKAARAALDAARANPTQLDNLDGGIYEASAVGICHYHDPSAPNCLLVVDVGAGTTDVAGLMRESVRDNIRVIRTARRTIDVAGDNFDAALLDLLMSKAKGVRSPADRAAFWRHVMPKVRELKEELFEKGRTQVEFRGAVIKCNVREFERQKAFKVGMAEIEYVYEASLAEVLQVSRRARTPKIGVVLAGGGSRLPAIKAMVTKKKWRGFNVKVVHLPTTPAWAHELDSAEEFESLFAQLSAAFGAAISGAGQGETPLETGGPTARSR